MTHPPGFGRMRYVLSPSTFFTIQVLLSLSEEQKDTVELFVKYIEYAEDKPRGCYAQNSDVFNSGYCHPARVFC